jgi:hypothetical protein
MFPSATMPAGGLVMQLKTRILGLLPAFLVACSSGSPKDTQQATDVDAGEGANGASSTISNAVFAASAVGPQWVQTGWSAGNDFFSLYGSPGPVVARIWDSLNGGRLFVTSDNGATWAQIGSADSELDVLSMVVSNGALLAGTWNAPYQSTSGGASWSVVAGTGLPSDVAVRSIATIGGTLFVGTTGHVYRSLDNGGTWTDASSGIGASASITSIVAGGTSILAASDSAGVFLTSNGGTSWTARNSGLGDTHIRQIAVLGSRLFAVTLKGVFVSDDNAANWTAYTSTVSNIDCLLVLETQLFAGTDGNGVHLSVDNGATWTAFDTGLPSGSRVRSLAANTDYIFAGVDSGIWRTPSTTVPNAAPTIALPASATPSVVAGSATSLGVLGADDAGEANLTYTWATTGASPAAVTFAANGSNAAKNTTATFTRPGDYFLEVTVRDPSGLSTTSQVKVTVAQTLTSISVSPTTATVAPGGAQQFAATGQDQFGAAMATQPTFAWSTSGGGSLDGTGLFTAGSATGGPFTVTATVAGMAGAASVTVAAAPTTVYQINCGGAASSPFTADQYYSGGTGRTVTNSITISGITNPAPMAVYQGERFGNVTYTLPNLTAGAQYTVRLHFAELYWTATGKRVFNVLINGTTVLSSFDIYAAAGARYKAVLREFTATASSSGQIVVKLSTVTDNASIEGIELIAQTPNYPPTITMPAAAAPNPVSGNSTALSVLASDDGGEAALTYTWATLGTPPAAVSFSANGSNAAKYSTATFSRAGSYTLQVTAKDAQGLSSAGTVAVTVNQTLTSVVVSPSTATVNPSATQQFSATARDQFATNLSVQPTFTWSVTGGSISQVGLFTAGTSAGGPYTVTASSGGVSGTASVTVTQATVYQINCGGSATAPYTADQYSSGGTARTVTKSVTTTGVTNPAPQAVYQAERYGAVTYTLPSLTAGASYTVRLHFAELYWTASGKRRFNVAINGTTVLSSFDIYATAGAAYKAVVREFTAVADTSGRMVIKLTNVTDNATIEGIQVSRQ